MGGLCEFREMVETIFYTDLEGGWEENPPELVILLLHFDRFDKTDEYLELGTQALTTDIY